MKDENAEKIDPERQAASDAALDDSNGGAQERQSRGAVPGGTGRAARDSKEQESDVQQKTGWIGQILIQKERKKRPQSELVARSVRVPPPELDPHFRGPKESAAGCRRTTSLGSRGRTEKALGGAVAGDEDGEAELTAVPSPDIHVAHASPQEGRPVAAR